MADRQVRAINYGETEYTSNGETTYTGKYARMAERSRLRELYEEYKGGTILFILAGLFFVGFMAIFAITNNTAIQKIAFDIFTLLVILLIALPVVFIVISFFKK